MPSHIRSVRVIDQLQYFLECTSKYHCFVFCIYIYNIYLYLPWAHCDLLLGIPGIQRSATYVCKFQPGQCLTNSHLSGHIRLTLRTYWPPASLALAMIPMINEPTSHLDTMNLSTKTSMDHPSSALSDGGLKYPFLGRSQY